MEHCRADLRWSVLYAWRTPGALDVQYRLHSGETGWADTEVWRVPELERALSVPELMERHWRLVSYPEPVFYRLRPPAGHRMRGQCDGCPAGESSVTVVIEREQDHTGMGGPPREVTYHLCDYHRM